ncbi:transporter [Bacteroidia bacterium]|nr:transporter [Bacteroidia bacterium]
MKISLSKKMSIVVIALLSPWLMNAQDKSAPLEVTLEEAIEIALSESPTIRIADQEIVRVDYSKKSAWGALLPTLSASGQLTHFTIAGKIFQMGNELDIPTKYQLKTGLSLQLPILVPALWKSIEMSNLDMQLAVEKSRASKIMLRNDVTKAYYSILLAQDSYKVLQDGYALAEENYKQAKKRFEAGVAAEYDCVSAEVQMTNLQPTLLQVENGIAQAKLYLKVLMGVEMSVELTVQGNLSDFENEVFGLNDNSNIDLSNNIDLKQLDIQYKQLDKAISIQNTSHLPTLVGFGSYGYTAAPSRDMNLIFGADPDATPPNPGMPVTMKGQSSKMLNDGLILGLQLNIPIFSGMTNVHKTKQLKIQAQELKIQRDYAENQLNVAALTSRDNMDKAVKQVEAAKKAIMLSQKSYDISAKRYETGMGTMIELQSAQVAVTQANLSYQQAISDYLTAKADYEKIIGQQ